MDARLKVVARIRATPDCGDRLEGEMKRLVADTRREAGCLQYDLYRGTEDRAVFVFVEEWESQALWRAHMEGAALGAFNARISGMIAEAEILQLGRVV